jgi:hypothetical protein
MRHVPGATRAEVYGYVVRMRRGYEPHVAGTLELINRSAFDSLRHLVMLMVRREFCLRTGIEFDELDFDSTMAMSTAIASVIPADARAVLSRPKWRSLGPELLAGFAEKLGTADNAEAFVYLCEKSGILKNRIIPLSRSRHEVMCDAVASALTGRSGHELVFDAVASALTSFADHAAAAGRQFAVAKQAASLALLLKPRSLPTWTVMAQAAYFSGDHAGAVIWADKIIAFEADPSSSDAWERALAGGEPDLLETLEGERSQMRKIKVRVRGRRPKPIGLGATRGCYVPRAWQRGGEDLGWSHRAGRTIEASRP